MTTLVDIQTELNNTDSTFGINDRGQMYLQVHALNDSAESSSRVIDARVISLML